MFALLCINSLLLGPAAPGAPLETAASRSVRQLSRPATAFLAAAAENTYTRAQPFRNRKKTGGGRYTRGPRVRRGARGMFAFRMSPTESIIPPVFREKITRTELCGAESDTEARYRCLNRLHGEDGRNGVTAFAASGFHVPSKRFLAVKRDGKKPPRPCRAGPEPGTLGIRARSARTDS